MSLAGMSQTALHLAVSTADMGLGYRIDHRFGDYGIYTSAIKGNYRFDENIYIKDHVWISFGGMKFLDDSPFSAQFISAGINYHSYGEKAFPEGFINTSVFAPVSAEIGCGLRFKRFSTAINIDLMKMDVNINFGIVLN
uniref:Outer membrane protein beta-barrel domain-containing protein n=1 Tax=viral metagenome TaxID=1070528 RepID=A0A6M3LV31_9ZZZZ